MTVASATTPRRLTTRTAGPVIAGAAIVFVVAVIVGAVAPSLAPAGSPTPTLTGTWEEAASIFVNNARVVAVPFLLVLARWNLGRTRPVGDVVVAVLVTANVVLVGLALGRHQRALLPYLPHVPAEFGALLVSGATWVKFRDQRSAAQALLVPVLVVFLLLVLAAAVEAFAVPHAI